MVKRVLIRTLVVGLLLFIFVAGTLFLIRSLGASRLDAWKREMRAQGERLLVSELAPWAVVSNAMIPRLIAANKQLPECPFERGEFPLMEVTNGAARVAWACATNPWPDMHQLVDDNAAPLEAMRAVLKLRPRDLGWDYRDYHTLSVPFVDIRKAAQWLANVVIIELNRNRKKAAMTNLLASMDLVVCHEADGSFGYQMIRVALANLAFALSWEALQAGGWSDKELAALQTAWEGVSLGRPLEFSLRIERAIALNYFEMARRGKTNATVLIEDTVPPELEIIYTHIWQAALSSQDELMYLKDFQEILAAVSAVRRTSSAADLGRLVPFRGPWTGRLADYRFPMARAVASSMVTGIRNWARAEARRQLVLAAIGLERFHLQHGTYPEKLAQLVPEILPAVPVDFGDGKPVRYERQGEQFRLWSILEDTTVWPRAAED